jgi:hypothetical protein
MKLARWLSFGFKVMALGVNAASVPLLLNCNSLALGGQVSGSMQSLF